MLKSLHISNYALIDHIDLELDQGLNIITGETGGGKSIMLGALSLLLGGRADLRSVCHSDAKSVIEAHFDVTGNKEVEAYCKSNDLEWDDNRMILRREISPSGRSRAFINDSPVTLDHLRSVGIHLIDIHSQHQNQLLSDAKFQLDIIDTLASNAAALDEYASLYASYRAAVHKLKAARAAVVRDRDNAEFMVFQLEKLRELNLQPGEFEGLERERERLVEAAEKRTSFDEALEALDGVATGAVDRVSAAVNALDVISESLPPESDIPRRLDSIMIELGDIASTVERCAAAYPADAAAELEEIERRISDINDMMRRHNVASADELVDMSRKLSLRLERLDDADTVLAELEAEARKAKRAAMDMARQVSEARKAAAADFAQVLHDTATPLGMKNLVCDIAVTPADMSATGIDNVEFRFAFNKNQTPVPVSVAASGGEISRLMLSIKSIIAHRMRLPSIIFDEVDTGVSGDVADRMGRMMRAISADIQVVAITHLPQVAAKGQHHFKVFKHDTDNSTVTHLRRLSPQERVREIALMLSGDADNAAALRTAEHLLIMQQ